MSLIKKMRRHKAWLWVYTGQIDVYGVKEYGEPDLIDCRWDDAGELVMTPGGQQVLCNSVAYVDRDVPLGSVLMREPDPDNTVAPAPNLKQRVIKTTKVDNLKATETLFTVWV